MQIMSEGASREMRITSVITNNLFILQFVHAVIT